MISKFLKKYLKNFLGKFYSNEIYIKNKNPKNKIFLCSYPRSGNTALRLALTQGFLKKEINVSQIDYLTIEPYASSKKVIDRLIKEKNVVIKWHGFPMVFHPLNNLIYIYRDPISTCRSHFTYQKYRRKITQLSASEYIENFLLIGDKDFGRWDNHIQIWEKLIASRNGLIINFEEMIKNPKFIGEKIIHKFNLSNFDMDKFVESFYVERSSFLKGNQTNFFKSKVGHTEFNKVVKEYVDDFSPFIDIYNDIKSKY